MSTEAELNALKVADLTELLKEKGLPHTGKKADLVARLLEDSTPAAAPVEAAAAAAAPAAAEKPAAAAVKEAAPAAAKPTEEAKKEETPAAAADEKTTEAAAADDKNPLEMNEEERRVARAAKFGLPIASKDTKIEKIKSREERFKGELSAPAAGGGKNKGGSAAVAPAMTEEELFLPRGISVLELK
ncbi:hypothetical protein T484DRAFT_1809034 [Baffinella frigidus]|nr:hypothetical protein T484DRAFT_1809034 [Cryptophyta sp. CCMP2293]